MSVKEPQRFCFLIPLWSLHESQCCLFLPSFEVRKISPVLLISQRVWSGKRTQRCLNLPSDVGSKVILRCLIFPPDVVRKESLALPYLPAYCGPLKKPSDALFARLMQYENGAQSCLIDSLDVGRIGGLALPRSSVLKETQRLLILPPDMAPREKIAFLRSPS